MSTVAMVIQRFRPDFSGQGIQMEQLCQALAHRGMHPVVLSSTRGRASEWESCDGYRVRRVRTDVLPGSGSRSRLWMPMFGLRVFIELLRLESVDVVHVHGLNDGLYGASAFCRMRGVPLVFEMTLLGVDDPSSALSGRHLLARARRRAYRTCDAYVAMSRAFLPSYASTGLPNERLHVIPQGVDTRRFRPLEAGVRDRVRAELGCAPASPLAIFVGSLIERKGLDVLLAAWTMVHGRRPDARLLLVGLDDFAPGSHEQQFLEQQLSLAPPAVRATISRTGLRQDPERLLGAADVFAFPSRREGFGSAIIEAMACGLPCVVARMDGITDFLFSAPIQFDAPAGRAKGDGIVVPQGDAESLARALLDLFDQPAWAAEIAATGMRTARDRFDLDRVIAPAYEQLYASLIGGGSRRA